MSPSQMATHSSVLAWKIPGTGEPGGMPSMGSHRVGHDWSDSAAAAARCLQKPFSSRQTSHLMKPSQCLFSSVTLRWSPEHISLYSLNKITHPVLPSVILSILCRRRWSVVISSSPLLLPSSLLPKSLSTKFQGHIGNSKAWQQCNSFLGLPRQSRRTGWLKQEKFLPSCSGSCESKMSV